MFVAIVIFFKIIFSSISPNDTLNSNIFLTIAPQLSNDAFYPYFARVAPPDSGQAEAVVALMKLFNWDVVGLISANTPYGTGLIENFESFASTQGISIASRIVHIPFTVQQHSSEQGKQDLYDNIDRQLDSFSATGVRLFLMNNVVDDAKAVLYRAALKNLVGLHKDENGHDALFQWIATDGWCTPQFLTVSSVCDEECVRVLRKSVAGIIGIRPARINSRIFLDWLENVWNPNVTAEALDEWVSNWATISGSNSSWANDGMNIYAPFAYDSVWTLAFALQAACNDVSAGGTIYDRLHDGELVFSKILGVHFEGVTGNVLFRNNGDRPGLYEFVNEPLDGNSFYRLSFGTWLEKGSVTSLNEENFAKIYWPSGKFGGQNAPSARVSLRCPPLYAPNGGTMDCSGDGVSVGTICTFYCGSEENKPQAIHLVGSSSRRCMTSEEWTGESTFCKIRDPVLEMCNFGANSVTLSYRGQFISIGVVIGLFVVATTSVALSLLKWWLVPSPEKITCRITIVLSDKIQIANLFVTSLQLCAMALNSSYSFSRVSSSWAIRLRSLLAVAVIDVFTIDSSTLYWVSFWVCVVIGFLFSIYIFVLIFQFDMHLPNTFIAALTVIGPFVGTIAFIPLLSTLLSVFQCEEASMGREFLQRDCQTWCWEGMHLTAAIFSSISIIFFLPLALWARPVWHKVRVNMKIKANANYLILSTATNFLLTLNYTFLGRFPVLESSVYAIVSSLMLIFSYKRRPFNIEKVNMYCISCWLFPTTAGLFKVIDVFAFLGVEKDKQTIIWKRSSSSFSVETESFQTESDTLVLLLMIIWCVYIVATFIVDYIYYKKVFIKDNSSSKEKARKISEALKSKPRKSVTHNLQKTNQVLPAALTDLVTAGTIKAEWVTIITLGGSLMDSFQNFGKIQNNVDRKQFLQLLYSVHELEDNLQALYFHEFGADQNHSIGSFEQK